MPVFKHTVEKIEAALKDEKESLQTIAALIKYDPGLYFSFIHKLAVSGFKGEVTTMSQAASLLGSNAISQEIPLHERLDDDENTIILWCGAVLAGEAAILINEQSPVTEPEEAFFAAILPQIGMLLLLEQRPEYRLLLPLLLQMHIEDRIFLEDRLFQKNHISVLQEMQLPFMYRDVADLIREEHLPSDDEEGEPGPARLSTAHISSQLYNLAMAAEYVAQSVLFPALVMAQENLKQLNKRYFNISESKIEELLSNVIDRFETVSCDFGVEEQSSGLLAAAGQVHEPEVKFLTTFAPLLRVLNELFAKSPQERNILIWGEIGVGKRLLAYALHYHPENPRRTGPFLSLHCDTSERETLEEDIFGSGGGFWGTDQHKGALDIAAGGTILLKNIDKMPLPLQDRLADIIARVKYYRSRNIPDIKGDVLFILTSRKDLNEEVNEGRFSKMLMRAIDPTVIYIPPLRERRDDIGMVAEGIIKKYHLPLTDMTSHLSLQEFYDTYAFKNNLSDLKRLLFYAAAKKLLKS
ncbi:MAG TPA: sigma 54-interacting transcriptional regulator [Dissulfurispiraceae bacterium]|nr:sigma 54-interacting transcriptional regulator [Dissulfurispiraceae bacterium]